MRQVLVLAELGSIARSAAVLHLSQSALSRRTQMVKQQVGAALFLRTAAGVVPTDVGRVLAQERERGADHASVADRHQFLEPPVVRRFQNEGWVSVGIDHDTAQFAVQAIGRWWQKMGAKRYPRASELSVTAGAGGSNGGCRRLWKVPLQELATRLGLPVFGKDGSRTAD